MRILQVPESAGRIYHFSQGLDDRCSLDEYEKIVMPVLERFGCSITSRYFIWAGWHRIVLQVMSQSQITYGKWRQFFKVQLLFILFFDLKWQFDNCRTKNNMKKLGLNGPQAKNYSPKLIEYYLEHRNEESFPF